MERISTINKRLSSRTMIMSFLLTILIGAIMLMLPISLQDGKSLSFVDAVFVSSSAVSTTGISTIDVITTLSFFGQVVLAILIFVGGIGIAASAAFIMTLFKINITQQSVEILNSNMSSTNNILRSIVLKTIVYAVVIQSISAIMLFISFIQKETLLDAIWYAIFHSISAYANAGLTIIRDSESLIKYKDDILVNAGIMMAFELGGWGVFVISDIISKRPSKWSLHTKAALTSSLFLYLTSFLIIYFFDNYKPLEAVFLAGSSTSAGFSTTPMTQSNNITRLIIIIIMFIGASPASTGGGIRCTTVFVLYKIFASTVRGTPLHTFRRKINEQTIYNALCIFFLGLTITLSTYVLLLIFEKDNPNLSSNMLLFESFSAFGNVGHSLGATTLICTKSKILLSLLMYISRVGMLGVLGLFTAKKSNKKNYHVEEEILVG